MRHSLALGLTLAAVLMAAGCEKKDDKAPAGGATPAPAGQPAAAIPTEPIVTTPQALVKEFVDDTAAARAKYPRTTPFKVTGVVSGFGVDILKLKSEDKADQLTVECAFIGDDQQKIKTAKRGDKFTVIGKLSTYDPSTKTVELMSCKLAE